MNEPNPHIYINPTNEYVNSVDPFITFEHGNYVDSTAEIIKALLIIDNDKLRYEIYVNNNDICEGDSFQSNGIDFTADLVELDEDIDTVVITVYINAAQSYHVRALKPGSRIRKRQPINKEDLPGVDGKPFTINLGDWARETWSLRQRVDTPLYNMTTIGGNNTITLNTENSFTFAAPQHTEYGTDQSTT